MPSDGPGTQAMLAALDDDGNRAMLMVFVRSDGSIQVGMHVADATLDTSADAMASYLRRAIAVALRGTRVEDERPAT